MKKTKLTSLFLILLLVLLMVGGCGKPKQYTLTIAVEGDGTVTPAQGASTYAVNTVVTLTPTASSGSVFDHWGGSDGALVSSENTIVMDGNKSITAVFTKLRYPLNVTVAPENSGDVTCELVTTSAAADYEHGQTVRLTAVPRAGYAFDSWSGDLTGSDNPQQLLIDSAKNVTANFSAYSITIQTQPAGTVAGLPVGGAPTVKVATSAGTPVAGITVTVAEKGGQPFTGTKTRTTDVNGLAVFSDLVFSEGSYTLVFSSAGVSDVETNAFAVGLAGSGTADSPYLIHNLYGLNLIRNDRFKFYRLEADIDASATGTPGTGYYNEGKGWVPICQQMSYPTYDYFMGQIDGNGHIISNLYINRPSEQNVGFLGGLMYGSPAVKNLTLANVYITGGDYTGGLLGGMMYGGSSLVQNCFVSGTVRGSSWVGGLIGYMREGTVTHCGSSATVTATGYNVGGLLGLACTVESDGAGTASVTNCYATGNVTGSFHVGGSFGLTQTVNISQCYATGNVVANGGFGYVGGFAGRIEPGNFTDCYARGNVIGVSHIGGFAGYAAVGSVTRCYSTGLVTCAGSDFGGFMPGSTAAIVTACYYDSTISGSTAGPGTPLATAQMQNSGNYSGWDFVTVWAINASVNGGYPTLQNTTAD